MNMYESSPNDPCASGTRAPYTRQSPPFSYDSDVASSVSVAANRRIGTMGGGQQSTSRTRMEPIYAVGGTAVA